MSQDYAKKGDPKSEQKPPRAGSTKPASTRRSPPAALPPPAPGRAPRPSRRPPRLKDCPTATEAQKADARERFREAKERRSNTIRSKATRYEPPAGSG
ncbi:unnamed protein product [Phytophthora fragariaefolia]|uniref:Unnamed protein product n=1 Tax=Phytophthora fragariaefolia TaxID=1490495 RepID=A0A9W6YQ12_9STRA|nr:unnamed protein product [Phytophthora fragariaefolia]